MFIKHLSLYFNYGTTNNHRRNTMSVEEMEKKLLKGIAYTVLFIAVSILLLWAFETGQQKVDRWEEATGRYGEGLR